MTADWVVALAVFGVAFIATTAVRWKAGRHRRFRVTIVIERDYQGPGATSPEDGPSLPE